jgi:hypothetical protein
MDGKVIAALIGLAGISLGALLSGIGYFMKSRAERLQVKRNVLFHLLEIRFLLVSSYEDPRKITESYIELCKRCFEKAGLGADEGPPESLKMLIENHLKNVIEAVKPKIESDFISSYENSLKDLSKDDPVLAYRLRGRENLKEFLQAQDEYISSFEELDLFKENPFMADVLSDQFDEASRSSMEKLILDINSDVSLVSRKCGIGHWWSCRKIIRRNMEPTNCFDEVELEKALDSLLVQIVEAVNKE